MEDPNIQIFYDYEFNIGAMPAETVSPVNIVFGEEFTKNTMSRCLEKKKKKKMSLEKNSMRGWITKCSEPWLKHKIPGI